MSVFLDVLVRSSLVLGLGLLAAAALRRQPAAMRHWLLAAAIGFAAVQPVFALFLPSWQMPSVWSQEKSLPAAPATSAAETEMSFESVAPLPRPTQQTADWRRIAIAVWMAGSAVALAVIALAMGWLGRLRSRASAAGTEWDAALASVQRRIGVHRRVDIAITRHPAMLVTWGALRPAILLPADADTWTTDRKELVVAHEIAHLVRHDWLIQVLAETARAIYWFNPLFWIACARLRHESECASDDIVLETGIAGTSYASHLVDLARTFSVHGQTWLPAPSIARPSTLERRVRAMLNPRMNRRPISAAARFALAAVVFAISLPIAAASQGTGSPSGMLRDPQGRVLPGATVRLSGIGID
ncbi:MAG TPA: M56 family metallopeptidase, partial [Bradyrhizobium sp.]|nr:M56 family metallopeptidase [Bradyrhizobium sp.]